jgi:hypothetical protein
MGSYGPRAGSVAPATWPVTPGPAEVAESYSGRMGRVVPSPLES